MVNDYASQLCVIPNYLNQVIKKVTGFSPSYHIRQRIMLEARRNTYYSGKSMKEICYLLGFSDPAHFSKLFKKATGTNFVNYKKKTTGIRFLKQASYRLAKAITFIKIKAALKIAPLYESVRFPFFQRLINVEGKLVAGEISEKAGISMMDELLLWTKGLKAIREEKFVLRQHLNYQYATSMAHTFL